MDKCKGDSIPMTSTTIFDPSPDDHLVDGSLYRRIIRKLHYLLFMRLNIAFVVSKLSQEFSVTISTPLIFVRIMFSINGFHNSLSA